MSRLNLKKDGEQHNFWQNYTDLMSGFLIVFIIASLTAYTTYRIYVNKFEELGVNEANIKDIIIDAELYRKIKNFQEAQEKLSSQYFSYNSEYGRFECTIDVQFTANDFNTIQDEYREPLIEAGKQLDSIITQFSDTTGVKFKVIVEGRLANNLKEGQKWITPNDKEEWNRGMENSYKRARTVVELWRNAGIMKDLMIVDNSKYVTNQDHLDSNYSGELFIAGAGFGGQHRHKCSKQDPAGEDKNKTFVIQIIPYINF